MTELVVEAELVLTDDELDCHIRGLVGSINGQMSELQVAVDEAKSRPDFATRRGYASWTAYIADVFTIRVRLDRDRRRELVGYLSGEGMSQRAIAEVVGADRKTVRSDLAEQVGEIGPPASDPLVDDNILTDKESDDLAEELIAAAETQPTVVTGLDGKAYKPRPKPKPPTEEQLIAHHEAEKLVAEQESLNRWSRAVDGLTNALSFARSFSPPTDIPGNYLSVSEFKSRLAALTEISNQWKESK